MANSAKPSWIRRWSHDALRDLVALWLAGSEPRVPWYVKLLRFAIAAYAVSPVDLIPDILPGFGFVDDLVLVPLGVLLATRMIPADVLAVLRQRALRSTARRAIRWLVLAILGLWLVLVLAWAFWP